jgi:tRNA pseudouridine65 synthase
MGPDAILYRDEHVVLVNKPVGLLVHRSALDAHESVFALQIVRDLLGQRAYPVHRLDKPTSGVLMFGLSRTAARALADAFVAEEIHKRYLAVVRGYTDDEGRIEHPLTRTRDEASGAGGAPRPAVTEYRTLSRVELDVAVDRYPTSRYSLVEASPLTGRRHQLRRHFKHIAHPIIGDRKYGKNVHNDFFDRQFGSRRLLLHAFSLTFPHPDDGTTRTVTAPLDAGVEAVLRQLGWPPERYDPALVATTHGPFSR